MTDQEYKNPLARQCKAKSKATGKQCQRPAMKGGMVCQKHGGTAPQVKAKAAERYQTMQSEQAARRLGLLVDISPQQALIDEVQRSAGMVCFYQARIDQIADEMGIDALPAAPWLDLMDRERDRLVRASSAALKAGIDERTVRLAEQQGALVAACIKRILVRLNLTAAQNDLVPVVVPEELRALTSGA